MRKLLAIILIATVVMLPGCREKKQPPRYPYYGSPTAGTVPPPRPPVPQPAPVYLQPAPAPLPAPSPAPVLDPVPPPMTVPPTYPTSSPSNNPLGAWVNRLSKKTAEPGLTVWFTPTPTDEEDSARVYWTYTGQQNPNFRFAGFDKNNNSRVVDHRNTGSSGFTDANRRYLEQVDYWTVQARRTQ